MPDKKMARHVTHGLTGKRVYKTWESMKARCYNPNDGKYEKYGGRGIKVCEEWLGKDGARNFAKWAYENGFDENKHQKEQSIDRIDVNGNYEPNNCWFIANNINAGKDKIVISSDDFDKIKSMINLGVSVKEAYTSLGFNRGAYYGAKKRYENK